ncbi:hypothetical protein PoB_005350600 [Plakobranchus ocellatus]|uniref:Uncharacterized protein n=1 Tax=Plakobranchus ocellatus TaxID=259542 RepID=A0AAV4C6N5_9GAST|nr:hypothetical protein PoB_005350600 [Plakobranchus ocellatus]
MFYLPSTKSYLVEVVTFSLTCHAWTNSAGFQPSLLGLRRATMLYWCLGSLVQRAVRQSYSIALLPCNVTTTVPAITNFRALGQLDVTAFFLSKY